MPNNGRLWVAHAIQQDPYYVSVRPTPRCSAWGGLPLVPLQAPGRQHVQLCPPAVWDSLGAAPQLLRPHDQRGSEGQAHRTTHGASRRLPSGTFSPIWSRHGCPWLWHCSHLPWLPVRRLLHGSQGVGLPGSLYCLSSLCDFICSQPIPFVCLICGQLSCSQSSSPSASKLFFDLRDTTVWWSGLPSGSFTCSQTRTKHEAL